MSVPDSDKAPYATSQRSHLLEPVWIVGFAGHRPGEGPTREEAALKACLPWVEAAIRRLIAGARRAGGRIEFLVSTAMGCDLDAAEVAESLGIPVHLIIPLPESLLRDDYAGARDDSWQRASRLIAKARSGEDGWSLRVAEGPSERPDCYHAEGLAILERSDILLVVSDGLPARGIGGTEQTVEQARRLGVPVWTIGPANPGAAMAGLDDDPAALPVEVRARLQPDATFEDLTDHVGGAIPASTAIGEPAGSPAGGDRADHPALQRLDEVACRLGGTFRARLTLSISLHYLAALLAATSASMMEYFRRCAALAHGSEETSMTGRTATEHLLHWLPKAVTATELALVTWAAAILVIVRLRHLDRGWRQTRFAAELARSIHASAGWIDPLRPLIQRRVPEWRRFALAFALSSHRSLPANEPLAMRRDRYLRDRIEHQRLHYFRRQHASAGRWVSWLSLVGFTSGIGAVFFVGAALAAKALAPDWVREAFWGAVIGYWFPIVLPLSAGTCTALLVAKDASRRKARYIQMEELLGRTARGIPGLRTESSVRQMVAETEDALLDELGDWHVATHGVGH